MKAYYYYYYYCCLPLLLLARAAAFLHAPRVPAASSRSVAARTARSVASPPPSITTNTPEHDCPPHASPASVFGKPLDQSSRDRNTQLVRGLKSFLFDGLFQGTSLQRAYARFYALETIARMPYFSYLSVLHLFETLGLWRRADYLKIHFAESWNELHHLLIMEELGGNAEWKDRWIAQHVAFFYYWIVVTLYLVNPTNAYHLNQAVEEEAYETYHAFLTQHADYLKEQPAPRRAMEYYTSQDLYLFDAMHHAESPEEGKDATRRRRPNMETLYDCFVAIRDDEAEHVKTMAHLQKDGTES